MSAIATIVCFGETLWDVLPTGRRPGGAPFNVALHLHQLGQQVQLISQVGDDELGHELLAFLRAQGLDPALMQLSAAHLTGVVKANVQAGSQQVHYEIVQPVAWDYIHYTEAQRATVCQARMLVYGTLAARCSPSRETLYRLLQSAAYKVLDVNLRPPHCTREVLKYLLRQADLVKLSENELATVMSWHGLPTNVAMALPWLAAHYELHAVCLTRGAAGASLYMQGRWWHCAGFAVEGSNPIGCGDAFLAALLAEWSAGVSPGESLRQACAAGAVVASRRGATLALLPHDLRELLNSD